LPAVGLQGAAPLIPGIYIRLAILALALGCMGYIGYRLDRNGYDRANREWVTKAQASEIRALKVAAERDELARKVASESNKALARSLAEVEVRREEVIQRIVPKLPVYSPQCDWPDSVRDEIQAQIDRANSANSGL
jgi:hypothetical protein